MLLIVGLGNPGQEYKNTRHNIGARIVDELEASLENKEVILAKPTTFMNESGKAIKILMQKSKIKNQNLFIIHDDIDIPLGEFKIQNGRGSAGHKGVESIIKEFGTKDFNRIRIGICPETGKPNQVDAFVLQNFTKSEEKTLKETMKTVIEKIEGLGR